MKKLNTVFTNLYIVEGIKEGCNKEDIAKDILDAFNSVMERAIALKRFLVAAKNKEAVTEELKTAAFEPISVNKMSVVLGSKYVSKTSKLVSLKFNIVGYYAELKKILRFLNNCYIKLTGEALIEEAAADNAA